MKLYSMTCTLDHMTSLNPGRIRVPFTPELLTKQKAFPSEYLSQLKVYESKYQAPQYDAVFIVASDYPVKVEEYTDEFDNYDHIGFGHRAMDVLKDFLLYPGNQVECYTYEGWPLFYKVRPVAPPYREPFPTYAEIAAQLPPDLHYFRKFANANFHLVTQAFVDRVQEHGIKGFGFMLRWDGEKVYPPLPKYTSKKNKS